MIEQLCIGEMAGGDPVTFERYVEVLRSRQDIGELRILGITDGVATVEYLDQRLFLTLADAGEAH